MTSIRKLAFASFMVLAACAPAMAQTAMTIVSGEGCGCCREWVKHLSANGFQPTISYVDPAALNQHKHDAGLKPEHTSCHTGKIGGYVIEGHVPAKEVARLLREKPDALGLTVPGAVWIARHGAGIRGGTLSGSAGEEGRLDRHLCELSLAAPQLRPAEGRHFLLRGNML